MCSYHQTNAVTLAWRPQDSSPLPCGTSRRAERLQLARGRFDGHSVRPNERVAGTPTISSFCESVSSASTSSRNSPSAKAFRRAASSRPSFTASLNQHVRLSDIFTGFEECPKDRMMELKVFVMESGEGNGFMRKSTSRLHGRKAKIDFAFGRHRINCLAPHAMQILAIRI